MLSNRLWCVILSGVLFVWVLGAVYVLGPQVQPHLRLFLAFFAAKEIVFLSLGSVQRPRRKGPSQASLVRIKIC